MKSQLRRALHVMCAPPPRQPAHPASWRNVEGSGVFNPQGQRQRGVVRRSRSGHMAAGWAGSWAGVRLVGPPQQLVGALQQQGQEVRGSSDAADGRGAGGLCCLACSADGYKKVRGRGAIHIACVRACRHGASVPGQAAAGCSRLMKQEEGTRTGRMLFGVPPDRGASPPHPPSPNQQQPSTPSLPYL